MVVITISWDDTKVSNDDITSADYNNMVTDQKTRAKLNPHESKNGSDCSLTDGVVNRVLTLSNTSLTKASGLFVFVNGLFQHASQLTVSHLSASSTITFLDNLWDADKITVVYMT